MADEIWYVPITSRNNPMVTTVVEVPAIHIALAMLDYHAGIDCGWAGYVPLLLNARTTREKEGLDEWELESQFRASILKPSALA
jgi:hypothetical protein